MQVYHVVFHVSTPFGEKEETRHVTAANKQEAVAKAMTDLYLAGMDFDERDQDVATVVAVHALEPMPYHHWTLVIDYKGTPTTYEVDAYTQQEALAKAFSTMPRKWELINLTLISATI